MPASSLPTDKWEVLNTYFDKIYLLTIPRNENRRLFLDQHLAGLDFTYFYGVDGKGLLPIQPEGTDEYDYLRMTQHNQEVCRHYLKIPVKGPVHANEIACSWSHKLIYQDIVQNGYDKALILEDDVQCLDQNLAYLKEALEGLPADWEMVYLGYELNFDFSFGRTMKHGLVSALYHSGFRMGPVRDKYVSYPQPYGSHLKVAGVHTNTEAYAIRKSTAQKFMDWQTPVQWIADHLLMDVCAHRRVKAFMVDPKIFAQNKQEFKSSIWSQA